MCYRHAVPYFVYNKEYWNYRLYVKYLCLSSGKYSKKAFSYDIYLGDEIFRAIH